MPFLFDTVHCHRKKVVGTPNRFSSERDYKFWGNTTIFKNKIENKNKKLFQGGAGGSPRTCEIAYYENPFYPINDLFSLFIFVIKYFPHCVLSLTIVWENDVVV